MTKLLIAICVALAVSLGMTGCRSVKTEPQPALSEIGPLTDSPTDKIAPRKPAESEPNDIAPSPIETPDRAPAEPMQPQTDPARTNDKIPTEPNAPAAPNIAVPTETTPSTPSHDIAPTEPNLTIPSQTPESEPDAPLVTEPTDIAATPKESPPTAETAESRPVPLDSFYQGYAEILQKHVRKDGRVDYASLRRRRLQLKKLLNAADELDPHVYQSWPQEEKLAFWINTYNLKMLEIIARNYPIQSSWWLRLTWPPSDIRHIGRIWSDYRLIVMDEEFTLGDVERRLLGKTFADPRAYLAITYAGRSSPSLHQTPYRGAELDRQLDTQVKAFLAGEPGFRIDRDKGIVYLSALFKPSWRGREFVGQYATDKKFKDRPPETRAVLNFLTQHISPEDIYYLEVENYTISYMNFDWRLNDVARRN